jgi:uncharacterized protein YjbI with pentapeptide repeats
MDESPVRFRFVRFRDWEARHVAGIILLIMVFVGSIGYNHLHKRLDFTAIVSDFYANVATELGSIVITVIVIDGLNRRRSLAQEKETLTLQMGSPHQGFAVEAARMLRVRGWLIDGTLRKINLFQADLQGAVLAMGDLQMAFLVETNLQDADLRDINLQGGYLGESNLQAANLQGANLRETNMVSAKLQGANLRGANLQKARLGGAILTGADLRGAIFDRETVLPDKSYWTEDTDLSRFTHPDDHTSS